MPAAVDGRLSPRIGSGASVGASAFVPSGELPLFVVWTWRLLTRLWRGFPQALSQRGKQQSVVDTVLLSLLGDVRERGV